MATAVTRVLPWRRGALPADEIAPLLAAYRARHPRASTAMISRAYAEATNAHAGQFRASGDAYVTHPLAVAQVVAELGLDDVSIAAALLHDAVEDTFFTLDDIVSSFGPEVAAIVDGVTKLDRVRFDSREAQQAATIRKMLVAMAKDMRVLLIKLADRLHNLRTIAALPGVKQHRIATETLEIFAPLAHRLGMQDMRQQLEDLSFATLYPKRYAEIEQMVTVRGGERDLYLHQVLAEVRDRLAELGVAGEVTGRPKHLWSIYEKMVVKGKEFNDIFDLVGIRVLVDRVEDCYAALGTIHATWKPVQGRIKDYIAMPKFNLYQSLHTTVIGPQGKHIEVQIRTTEMHRRAEYGVAAHWAYKDALSESDIAWLSRIVDWQSETDDPNEFMETLKDDLEQDEVFVFTPKGKVVTLAGGATPIDFAYAIHTEVGHACRGAKVNGRLSSLEVKLVSGDTVDILTAKADVGPSRDWLDLVVTPRAKSKIRQWFSRERREDAMETGRDELVKALRREGLPVQKLQSSSAIVDLAKTMSYSDVEALHVAIGQNHVSARSVAQRLGRTLRSGEGEEQVPITARAPRKRKPTSGIHVEGLDDVMLRLSRCCTPVPGDEIMGFVTRGRGVSVHRADCANAVALGSDQSARLIEVEWDQDTGSDTFVVSIEVRALDRSKLLRDVSATLADHRVNILACATQTGTDRISRMRFDFELVDPSMLDSLITTIRRIDAVYDAYRVLPRGANASA
ncbi:MAG: bifunctional (p)ppGpp synthetase/guanosine-3',5'-bis(diphosphate) 3'-pyrophosphohydrolase [Actinomycetota bacterium]|nr:bifunctional (p)ppGpp synthetase/guanosine-3',5'-bis(diphosphate) 3'-pyrophosphohydrolase [Acidimicrobiia bacterium]MDQ3148101.1 bifunctional (p)ppGpp synthetase/guanosine-3',5'-bis(diphosphate) 3'-pyrophosphohydrolase [Actinomycetota bacterium]